MNRRHFLGLGGAAAAAARPALPFQDEKSKLKITGVRLVSPRPRVPRERYTPPPGSHSLSESEIANPMSIYPEYKAKRSLFQASGPGTGGFWVEITTDRGVKGLGSGGPAGGPIVENHLTRFLIGQDPFNIERLWDIMWRSTMYYGRMGVTMNAISGVDNALWDLIGNALGLPVYKLLGGAVRDRTLCYVTGNNLETYLKMGFTKLKLATPYGPADGRAGMKKNFELAKQTRDLIGGDGDVMLDCWMAFTEAYTIELAQMLEPLRIYWMEECLQPHDYAGFGRLRAQIKSTLIVTGEHEYGRYGFRQLLEHNSAAIWQPDMHWCGGLTELRRIAALAAAYDIPVLPHSGGARDSIHFGTATVNSPMCEIVTPLPTQQFAEEYQFTKGPEGVYTRPSDKPGFGWDVVV
jgi:L-rhamnonate dehydratase